MSERDLDVVVLGATGVTGRQVAGYLATREREDGFRWAAAARDETKLARLLDTVGAAGARTLRADVADPASLAELASRTKVVLDLVGPYTLYGRPVVKACVEGGAHYADLTGEIPFVRSIIDEFDAAARAANVKVAQVCGFEALPPDMAVLLAAQAARERYGEDLAQADLEATVSGPPGLPRASDSISGGTLQSLLAVAQSEGSATITDPGLLIQDGTTAQAVRKASPIGLTPRRGHGGAVIAPMAPAPFINPAVIHRTAALDAAFSGRAPAVFRYREGLAIGGSASTLPLRWGAAGALSGTQVALRGFASAGAPARRRIASALARVTPKSGFGPAPERLHDWKWGMQVFARTTGGHEVRVGVDAEGHPGYLATARMLGELGILLATPGATPERSGAMTPAIALGTASAPAFAKAGVRFSVAPA